MYTHYIYMSLYITYKFLNKVGIFMYTYTDLSLSLSLFSLSLDSSIFLIPVENKKW